MFVSCIFNSCLWFIIKQSSQLFLLCQFAADYTEKTLFKFVMVRLLKSALDGNHEDLATILSEEILNVDDQLLSIEKDTHEVSGTNFVCISWLLEALITNDILYIPMYRAIRI